MIKTDSHDVTVTKEMDTCQYCGNYIYIYSFEIVDTRENISQEGTLINSVTRQSYNIKKRKHFVVLSESLLAAVLYIPRSSLEVNKKKFKSVYKAFINHIAGKTNTYSSFNILYRMCFVVFDILIIVRREEQNCCLYSFSCFSVEREASKNIEENERECFKDAIVSSRSLNKGFVEPTNIKNAIPEV